MPTATDGTEGFAGQWRAFLERSTGKASLVTQHSVTQTLTSATGKSVEEQNAVIRAKDSPLLDCQI